MNGVTCPYCGTEHTDTEALQYVIHFYSADGFVAFSCSKCDKDFLVREHVERTWEVKKGD